MKFIRYCQLLTTKKLKLFLGLVVTFLLTNSVLSQNRLSSLDEQSLIRAEDSLKKIAIKITASDDAAERFRSDSQFTRMLVRALKTKHSFEYPFDSLINISRLYAPDSSFRIITWQVMRDENLFRRHGALQIKTKDGTLKLFPLIDRTFLIKNQADTITNNEWWIGAIYYKILLNEFNNNKYYTLLGYDENSIRSTMKRIEVLQFDKTGNPVFGGHFSFAQDTIKKKDQSRFWIEYKKNGNARMSFDEELNLIIFDHLISETNELAKKYTYIPDGDYEGFKWVNGKWLHIEKVFTFKLQDGQAPVENPIKEKKLGGD